MDESVHPHLLAGLSEQIIRSSAELEWEGFLRLENIWNNNNFVQKLARSGFKKAYFGLEVVSSETRAVLNKKDNAKNISSILKNCNEYGIKVHLFCMFGYPGTTKKDAMDTVEFIIKNIDLIDTIDFNTFQLPKDIKINGLNPLISKNDFAIYHKFNTINDFLLSSKIIDNLVDEIEDVFWNIKPQLLHPVYRLVSPWYSNNSIDRNLKSYANNI